MCVSFFYKDVKSLQDEYYMEEAIKEAQLAYSDGDVPVGAILVYNNKIIARNHNRKEQNKNAIDHAEMLVIREGCKHFNNWHLEECTLYVTLEPCLMCAGAIIQSRIKRLVYATSSPKFGYIESLSTIVNKKNNHIPIIESGICEKESIKLLKNFFKDKRG